MTVEEIKAKLPEADVYCLDENLHYLVVVDKQYVNMKAMDDLAHCEGFPKGTAIIGVMGSPADVVRILEIKEPRND